MKRYFDSKEAKFIGIFLVIFLATFIVLYVIGLVPSEIIADSYKRPLDFIKIRTLELFQKEPQITSQPSVTVLQAENPVKIEIPKIGVDVVVENPLSDDVNILDEYLKKGAVRYPGSGRIGADNMFIFGHSSTLASVQNIAYKAFNRIEELKAGDEIFVYSEEETYLYKVTSERRASAEEAFVNFTSGKNMLTLSTCDSFGKQQDRFVVEAEFVGKI